MRATRTAFSLGQCLAYSRWVLNRYLSTEQTGMGLSLPREAAPIAFPETSVELTRDGREKFHFMYQGQLIGSGCLG